MKITPLLVGIIIFLSLSTPALATVVASSTFDSDLNGWTGVAGQTTFITYASTGGNPGGYIRNNDRGPTGGQIVAPVEYLGNWTSLDGVGTLKWDFNLLNQGIGTISEPLDARISGPGGSATFDSGIFTPVGSWITVTAPIDETLWTLTTGDWDSLLGDVTELRLLIENVFSRNGGETTGIDNVSLSAVPLPASVWLFGSGIIGLLRFRHRILA